MGCRGGGEEPGPRLPPGPAGAESSAAPAAGPEVCTRRARRRASAPSRAHASARGPGRGEAEGPAQGGEGAGPPGASSRGSPGGGGSGGRRGGNVPAAVARRFGPAPAGPPARTAPRRGALSSARGEYLPPAGFAGPGAPLGGTRPARASAAVGALGGARGHRGFRACGGSGAAGQGTDPLPGRSASGSGLGFRARGPRAPGEQRPWGVRSRAGQVHAAPALRTRRDGLRSGSLTARAALGRGAPPIGPRRRRAPAPHSRPRALFAGPPEAPCVSASSSAPGRPHARQAREARRRPGVAR